MNINRTSIKSGKYIVFAAILTMVTTLFLTVACGNGNQPKGTNKMNGENIADKIRQPAVAGQFYTSDPYELRSEVESYINNADLFPQYEPVAIVSPHAGYVYSGWVAGYSYKQVQGKKYDVVVVISPSHVEHFEFSSVMTEGFYKTPLGLVGIDSELATAICDQSTLVMSSEKGHFSHGMRGEHALEVQIPFLQVALGDFRLVPIVMGDQGWSMISELGEALGKVLKGKNALIVASTDLSHFHSYNDANRLDSSLIESLESFNPEACYDQLHSRKVEACGGGPVVAAMIAGKKLGAAGLKALKHANSGDVPVGSKDSVVGYLSAIIYKSTGENESSILEEQESTEYPAEDGLTLEEKRYLMEIAKTTVEHVVRGKAVPDFQPRSTTLGEDRGAFVTLKIEGQLRGCIGYIIAVRPLYMTVREVAESAALRDPRFPPVSPSELPELEYEISALSPVREINDVDEIEVGVHGIIIRRGYNQGLLLPQVATEYGWDRKTFLEHTCRKAGLPIDAWKDPATEISIFSAEVFDEEELK